MDERHRRPAGTTDASVEAVGKVSEGLEWVERARGHLYEFHQLLGRADLLFGEAADALRDAGHDAEAAELEAEVVGRNVLDGRWTFQIIEEFDAGYWEPVRAREAAITDRLMDGRRHVFEAEMKETRRTTGRPHHESRPPDAHDHRTTPLDGDGTTGRSQPTA